MDRKILFFKEQITHITIHYFFPPASLYSFSFVPILREQLNIFSTFTSVDQICLASFIFLHVVCAFVCFSFPLCFSDDYSNFSPLFYFFSHSTIFILYFFALFVHVILNQVIFLGYSWVQSTNINLHNGFLAMIPLQDTSVMMESLIILSK